MHQWRRSVLTSDQRTEPSVTGPVKRDMIEHDESQLHPKSVRMMFYDQCALLGFCG